MSFIYLFRHGIAQDREAFADDRERPLTAHGKEKTRTVAQTLHNLGLEGNLILTSPLLRARQTAEILADCHHIPIEVVDWLAPEGSFGEWETWFDRHKHLNSLFLVGHEPDLSMWAELMTWGQVSGNVLLKKAGMIGLISDPNKPLKGNCIMFLLVPPKILQDLR